MPNAPSFMRTPAWTIETAVGAAMWPSGDQVWNGQSAASTPQPMTKNGKKIFWKVGLERAVARGPERGHIEGAEVRLVEGGEDADPDEDGAADQHERQLHRAVLFARGAPDADQQVERHHRELVEEEEEEEVEREERAVDAGDEDEEEDEEVLRAEVQLPARERAGEGDDAGEQRHQRRDAVDAEVERDAARSEEGRVFDPRPAELHLDAVTAELVGDEDVDREAEHDRREEEREM